MEIVETTDIVSVKYSNVEQTALIVNDIINVPVAPGNRHYTLVQEWVVEGNTIAPYVEPSLPVPTSISKLQLKYALDQDWPTVKAYIDADPNLVEDWNLASSIYRDSQLVNNAATALGYTAAQMDDIFINGSTILV